MICGLTNKPVTFKSVWRVNFVKICAWNRILIPLPLTLAAPTLTWYSTISLLFQLSWFHLSDTGTDTVIQSPAFTWHIICKYCFQDQQQNSLYKWLYILTFRLGELFLNTTHNVLEEHADIKDARPKKTINLGNHQIYGVQRYIFKGKRGLWIPLKNI